MSVTPYPPASVKDKPFLPPLKRPLDKIYAFWFAGMSCDGCSIAATAATNPPVEKLLLGQVPGLPKLILHHPVLAIESGVNFVDNYRRALRGELDAPYVIILEGSACDESLSGDGYWVALGVGSLQEEDARMIDGVRQPVPVMDWIKAMAPGAAAAIAIGTCATWGGIPSAYGNVTGAMSLQDLLGKDYRSAFGLPVINVPGCSPVGDNFMETVAAAVLFLQGMGPLPEFDELGRPNWLFGETVHRHCVRAGYYEEGVFAKTYGDKECLVEVGCWGPVVQCNITERGAINGLGGCMNTGGPCIGCTMPGFPDKFSPFYKTAPGSVVSSNTMRTTGSAIRRLRAMSNANLNRTTREDNAGYRTSGWQFDTDKKPGILDNTVHYFYEKWQFHGTEKPGSRSARKKVGRS
ncbi:MAG TPA: hydrogenase expression protein HypE [Candidatus Sulfotelmatobacter sp.]|nr:hydrogenase expression protein HypE [Candidatus Sulfotelmatobacter sp.]